MSLYSIFGKINTQEHSFPSDKLTTRDGKTLEITFIKHASLAITFDGTHHIYIDPVSEYADYVHFPKADVILVTHSHFDHFDLEAIKKVQTTETTLVCDHTTGESAVTAHIMHPGEEFSPRPYLKIEAVAAYNTSEGHTQFHPKTREDCGYVLTIGGTRIYISGDSEPTEEMYSLHDIDIAFLPVNQPYTMTVDQVVEAIRHLHPKIFYPYHYGEVEEKTDLERLKREVSTLTEIRIRPME